MRQADPKPLTKELACSALCSALSPQGSRGWPGGGPAAPGPRVRSNVVLGLGVQGLGSRV